MAVEMERALVCCWLKPAGLSLLVEVLQLITSRGLLEFDDVFHNMIGAVVGVGIVMVVGKELK